MGSPSDVLPLDPQLLRSVTETVLERCDALARLSEWETGLKRTFCSDAMADAYGLVRGWMESADMRCRLDPMTNLIGRYQPAQGSCGPTVILGSHLDTVPNAGKYDGILGVLLGLGVVDLIRQTGQEIPLTIDVIGFCEEEGVRYQAPFLGSSAIAGRLDQDLLDRCDAGGTPMRDAITQFGGDPNNLSRAAYDAAQVVAYLEAHIEQGPVLEQAGLPVGVVSAISGQTWMAMTLVGEAGHAGTYPIDCRRDALVAAAHVVTRVEEIAASTAGLMATVGFLEVEPNVTNVIPGRVALRVDLRHPDNAIRRQAFDEIVHLAQAMSRERGIDFQLDWVKDRPAVQADCRLTDLLAGEIEAAGLPLKTLPSGAGHDAAIMAESFPMAMLFVRCGGGISHHPDESVDVEDVAVALRILWRAIGRLAFSAVEET